MLTLLFLPLGSFAQHSEDYLKFMNQFVSVDSDSISTEYNNGNPKYIGTTTYYKYNGEEYAFLTGKHIRYYRNGSRTEAIYDAWGTALENKYFDKKGNLISDTKTIIIDTSAKDVKEFEASDEHITFMIQSKDYKYSSKLNKWYVYLESEHTNTRKSGTWKYYFPNGDLKKTKKYF